ncbi:MAG: PAS domain S-box protein [Desulfarculaceae bacterium]
MAASLSLFLYHEHEAILGSAKVAARSHFTLGILYRHWQTMQNNKDAPVGPRRAPADSPPAHQGKTSSPPGRIPGKIHPAYETRRTSILGIKDEGVSTHITSLNPIRAENAPDEWEHQALEAFVLGHREVSIQVAWEGRTYLRLMRPVFTEESCLKCHEGQGYKVGAVCGGIGVMVPLEPYLAIKSEKDQVAWLGHIFFWLLGFSALVVVTHKLNIKAAERDLAKRALVESEARYSQIFTNNLAIMFVVDPKDGAILEANQAACDFYGYTPAEFSKMRITDLHTLPAERVMQKLRETLEAGNKHVEMKHRSATGQLNQVEVYISTIEMHKHTFWHCLVHDITERRHISEVLGRQKHYLAAMGQAIEVLTATRDLDQLLRAILVQAAELLDTSHGWIATLEEGAQDLVAKCGIGLFRQRLGWKVAAGQGVSGRIWKTGELFLEEDFQQLSNRAPGKGLEQVHPVVGVPLRSQGKFAGVLGLGRTERSRVFTDEEVTLLTEYASLASLALEKVDLGISAKRELFEHQRVEAQLRQRNYFSSALQEITLGLMNRLELSDLLETLIARVGELIEAPHSVIALLSDDGTELVNVVALGAIKDRVGQTVRPGEGVAGRVLNSGETISIEEYRSWEGRLDAPALQAMGPVAAAPLKSGAQVTGILQVARFVGERPFSSQEMSVLEEFARLGAVALDNARLYSAVQEELAERKRAQMHLSESEENYRQTFEGSPDAIGISEMSSGRFLEVNQGFCRLTGFSREEVLGKGYFELGVFESAAQWERLAEIVKEDGFIDNAELRLGRADGTYFEAAFSARPIKYQNSDCLVVVIKDITPLKQAEIEKTKLEAQLQQSQKMEAVGTLAGGVAHDFNNILQAIFGYTQLMLSNESLNEEGRRHLNQIEHAASQAAELVRHLMTFSRKIESQPKPVDLNHYVQLVYGLLGRTIPKMIEIKLDLAQDLKIVSADANQMEQVLLNLVTNSRDAMPQGGKLTIQTVNVNLDEEFCRNHPDAQPGEYVRLSVSDTGKGMDEETAAHIFEPFFTTKGPGQGTGLGLSTVYGIVKSHGGLITCYSQPREGTTFDIFIPVQPELGMAPVEEEKEEPVSGGDETILLVDDEQAVLDIASELLTANGYKVVTEKNGEDALARYKDEGQKIDLVILDLGMPGMGGFRCLRELVKVDPQVRILIASGYTGKAEREDIEAFGAKDYIAKPYRLNDLLAKVREILDQPS